MRWAASILLFAIGLFFMTSDGPTLYYNGLGFGVDVPILLKEDLLLFGGWAFAAMTFFLALVIAKRRHQPWLVCVGAIALALPICSFLAPLGKDLENYPPTMSMVLGSAPNEL